MQGSFRLRFEYSKGRIVLKDSLCVAKRAPAGDSQPSSQHSISPQDGIMLELRSGKDVVYRRQVAAMFPDSYEVQTGDPDRPFARSPRTQPYQVELLVPIPDKDVRLVLTEHRHNRKRRKSAESPDIVHVDEPLKLVSVSSQASDPQQGRP